MPHYGLLWILAPRSWIDYLKCSLYTYLTKTLDFCNRHADYLLKKAIHRHENSSFMSSLILTL